MNKVYPVIIVCLIFTLWGLLPAAEQETGLLRFPAVYENQIVFTCAGDLYTVSVHGGVARKLTNHAGFEMFPRFSPDGKQIAFTGQYDGNTEVYLMPAGGGVPRRLTYTATLKRDDVADRMGPNNIVMGWKHQSNQILFRSRMISYNSFIGQLFTVSSRGDMPEQLELPRGGFCSYSPDDTKLAYNRVFREFRTWKRYRGGMADDIWIHDFKSRETVNITNNPAQDIMPMWYGNEIYFISDRDTLQRMNLYVYEIDSENIRKLTDFKAFDIKFPSLGKSAIVFENGGKLYHFDLKSQTFHPVAVTIQNDFPAAREGLLELDGQVSNYEISPDGKRALFGARGEIFTVPAKQGQTRNLSQSSGIHERNSKWSPDGQWIAFISDKTGEDEIFIVPGNGKGEAVQITSGGETYKYQMLWSPDSKKLVWGDRRHRLRYVEIGSKKITDVKIDAEWEIRQYAWSPDSKWIAYMDPRQVEVNRIMLYSLESQTAHVVTDGWFHVETPAFSSDGQYLFFVSNRDFNPVYSHTEWNHAYQDMARIYLVTLARDVPSPFKPESDEVAVQNAETTKKKDNKEKEANPASVAVRVDAKGLKDRITALPIKPANYFNLTSADNALYYNRKGSHDEKTMLFMYDLKEKKETEIGQIDGFEISADKKKMLVSQGKGYAIIDLPKTEIQIDEKLNLSGLQMCLDRQSEWMQIFNECWRQMREFFYAPNMHGVDWDGMAEKYRPLLADVKHRADLTYVIGEMIGELNVGHAYAGGGDVPKVRRIQTGLLGADIVKDTESGYFRIKKILPGQNWDKRLKSPLTEIDVHVDEGDYILAVNGVSTQNMKNIYASLVNTAGHQVTLTVNKTAVKKGCDDVVVVPIADEGPLYYLNWVQTCIETVNKATDGKVGYIHVPDMGAAGLNEFVKYYYPQLQKKALIIDVRGNGGGNVSPQIIERLRREAAMYTIARNTRPVVNPGGMIDGPKVCLCDEFSASDGDLFAFRFKQHKLGTLIGKRTWGGVVGIRGSLPLVDGGQLYKPEFSRFNLEGSEWPIEGVGVIPDIVIDNDPAKEFDGVDQQLNKAIDIILEALKKEKEMPEVPPYPIKRPVE